MQKIISKREKLILSVTIGVIIFSLVFNFTLLPIMAKNDALNKEIESAKARLKKYHWLISQKEYIYQQYDKISKQLSSGDNGVKPPADILSQIEELAKISDINIVDMRPQVFGADASLRPMAVDLRAQGNVDGHLRFIYNLENSLFLFKIQRLQLNSKAGNSNMEGEFSIVKFDIPG